MALFKILKGEGTLPTTKTEGWAYVKKTGSDSGDFYVDYNTSNRLKINKYADEATKWKQSITLSFSGDITGSVSFDGGSDVSDIDLQVVDDSHNHVISNIDNLQTTLDGKASTGHSVFKGGTANKVWKTNASGTPGWLDDAVHSPNFTTGLKIGDAVGNTTALYVPNATSTQAGVITTGSQTFSGTKTFQHIVIPTSQPSSLIAGTIWIST